MPNYKYRVKYLLANVTDSDITKGLAGEKVAQQMEIMFNDNMEEGYEFYSQNVVTVNVQTGCGSGKTSGVRSIDIAVFRKAEK